MSDVHGDYIMRGVDAHARLLIFEDDADVGKIMSMIAIANGFESRVVARAPAFFRMVEDWQPTHISIDLVMPEIDGLQVLLELAKRNCRAKVIITSGMGVRVLDAAHRSADEHGLRVVGILPKPFSPVALRALLAESEATRIDTAGRPRDATASHFDMSQAELQKGLANRELRVVYQPQIACADGRLAGFEALVRWDHPQRGMITPEQFVPFAESHGLINALTHEVLDQALHWFTACFPDAVSARDETTLRRPQPTLSINLSAACLDDLTLVDRMSECCQRRGASAERLILEVTETSAMVNPTTALNMLTRLRVKGFQLSIDDFGTGYSSMLQLVRMPFSEIKIDKSFVMSAVRSAESRAVIQSIVGLGKSLGLKSIAEGVEDPQTLELLKQMRCDFAQGYWIGRPMDPNSIREWLGSRSSDGGN